MSYRTFSEFWPFYVREHSCPGTRYLHFLGTTLLFVSLGAMVITARWFFLPLGIVLAYGFAWIGHFFIEKNRPATFQYPFLSLFGDLKMYVLMCLGRMDEEVQRFRLKLS